jgi:hypothetical protein
VVDGTSLAITALSRPGRYWPSIISFAEAGVVVPSGGVLQTGSQPTGRLPKDFESVPELPAAGF